MCDKHFLLVFSKSKPTFAWFANRLPLGLKNKKNIKYADNVMYKNVFFYVILLYSPNFIIFLFFNMHIIIFFTHTTDNLLSVLRRSNSFLSETITLYLDSSLKWTQIWPLIVCPNNMFIGEWVACFLIYFILKWKIS